MHSPNNMTSDSQTSQVTKPTPRTAVLIVNLGTPASAAPKDVGIYLREFLMDRYVIDLPFPLRWLLVNCIIVPIRARSSAHKYAQIWTSLGSPLLSNTRDFTAALRKELGVGETNQRAPGVVEELSMAMRYGKPDLESSLASLHSSGIKKLIVFPLYPQYALSVIETVHARVKDILKERGFQFDLKWIEPFYDKVSFIEPSAQLLRQQLTRYEPATSHVLFSFHGLPESHIENFDKTMNKDQAKCLCDPSCCQDLGKENRQCYRAQCYFTAREVVRAMKDLGLSLEKDNWSVAFQSRLGKSKWIQPYTFEKIKNLALSGTKTLYVVTPSFVSDCLESLEEIAIQMKTVFLENGGTDFRPLPCLNSDPRWVSGAAQIIKENL